MVRFLLILLLAVPAVSIAQSQNAGDTVLAVQLKPVQVTSRFKNDTMRYRYNQMRYYVSTILHYLDAATTLFREIDTKLNDESISRKERKRFVNSKEEAMRNQFEDKVRDLNVTQGILLVKLIARQTNTNLYQILRECKSPLTAIKWQGWARLHGMNLDRKYDPADEPDLELIMEDFGYPLPAAYAVNNN